jgi:hypothetical protein
VDRTLTNAELNKMAEDDMERWGFEFLNDEDEKDFAK